MPLLDVVLAAMLAWVPPLEHQHLEPLAVTEVRYESIARTMYALHEARCRRVALASAESPAWTVDQLAAGCCSGVNGGGTVRCPTGRASSSARRRARVVAQYFGASSR